MRVVQCDFIAQRMVELGLDDKTLATKAAITPGYLRNIRRGQIPAHRTLRLLAMALECQESALIADVEVPPPKRAAG